MYLLTKYLHIINIKEREKMKLLETYSTGDYTENEVFQCENCGRTFTIQSGGDIAFCPCEFENEV